MAKALLINVFLVLASALAPVAASADAATAPQPVRLVHGDLELTVVTIGRDQATAFYLGRGLARRLVDRYATPCIVHVTMRTLATRDTLLVRLADWRVEAAGKPPGVIRGRGDWLAEFDAQGIETPARMGFEWAQLPEEVDINPGDSVLGMVSLPVARGEPFDLLLRWQRGDVRDEARFARLRCN